MSESAANRIRGLRHCLHRIHSALAVAQVGTQRFVRFLEIGQFDFFYTYGNMGG
jgi:hypothetical protein